MDSVAHIPSSSQHLFVARFHAIKWREGRSTLDALIAMEHYWYSTRLQSIEVAACVMAQRYLEESAAFTTEFMQYVDSLITKGENNGT